MDENDLTDDQDVIDDWLEQQSTELGRSLFDDPNQKQLLRNKSVGFFSFNQYDSPTKEGWLTKQGGRVKNWKRRWFVLRDDRLYYYKDSKDLQPLGFIPLAKCSMRFVSVTKKNKKLRYCFELYDPVRIFSKRHPSFFIFADSKEEMEDWVKCLGLQHALPLTGEGTPIETPAASLALHSSKLREDKVEREGWLWKRGGIVKNWKKRWFVLQGNLLYYYKTKDLHDPLGFIPVDRCSITVMTDEDMKKNSISVSKRQRRKGLYMFQIKDPRSAFNKWHSSYFMIAETEEDMNTWMHSIVNIKFKERELFNFKKDPSTPIGTITLSELTSNASEFIVELSPDQDPNQIAEQYGMENLGPVADKPYTFRFQRTGSSMNLSASDSDELLNITTSSSTVKKPKQVNYECSELDSEVINTIVILINYIDENKSVGLTEVIGTNSSPSSTLASVAEPNAKNLRPKFGDKSSGKFKIQDAKTLVNELKKVSKNFVNEQKKKKD